MAMRQKEVVEIIPSKDIFVGDPKAPVTLTEFGDYESEVCAKANEVVDKLLKEFKGKVRFNFRHFPLTRIHQHSMKAAEASLGAAQEGKFWDMHNMLFAHRRRLGAISLREYAKDVGVVNKKFLDDLVNSTYGWQVRSDLLEGLDRGVRDVPAFFINGELFTGKPTFDNLKKGIQAAMRQKKKRQTAREKV
ncbi:MAG: thioredoxin domain-containing protein [Bacteroidota bacterium]|nr:thioredoxin domain-containing protein [Bacteroidota bacterium]MDP4218410.1 thioredoxin domain-containing protein [Bacteroidota bacterium]MDP4246523.1 thioredoxin domain-containing protein [Bacteroidota bacterium]MDP4256468.1 thioredoxin domain-containing protein [Bacteroidota bacterium]MDP4260755.1 thioredoxin domain-containing protein [Bacteroidota bacterium]